MTTLDYRILPVQVPVHGLKESGLLTEPKGYELFRREGIKLVSMGIYPSEIAAKNAGTAHADPDRARFV
jgi:hypothetical protein